MLTMFFSIAIYALIVPMIWDCNERMYDSSIDRITGLLSMRVTIQKLPIIKVVIKDNVSTRILNHSGIASSHWFARMLSSSFCRQDFKN